jgi:cell division protein FtsI (penicillin-binding protein 3)
VIRDDVRQPVPRKVLGRAISADVAAQLVDIMEGVVTDGTGKSSQVAGYTIAGKTGTAQKVVDRRYSNTDYNVSFVGFVPSRQPQFTIVVVVDTPRKIAPYGSTVAAPIFQRIADAALRQYGVTPTINAAPPILVARQDDQPEQPASLALGPAADGRARSLVTLTNATSGGAAVFPDLRGLSAREALRVMAQLGLTARLDGTGVVIDQRPAPGAPIERGSSAVLQLTRAGRP